jgi:hypothetical protein
MFRLQPPRRRVFAHVFGTAWTGSVAIVDDGEDERVRQVRERGDMVVEKRPAPELSGFG